MIDEEHQQQREVHTRKRGKRAAKSQEELHSSSSRVTQGTTNFSLPLSHRNMPEQNPSALEDRSTQRSGEMPSSAAQGAYSPLMEESHLQKRDNPDLGAIRSLLRRAGSACRRTLFGPSSPAFCQKIGQKLDRTERRWKHIVREKRAKNFPESERRPIQFLLFAWSTMPLLASRLRDRIWKTEKRLAAKASQLRGGKQPSSLLFLSAGAAGLVLLLLCSAFTFGTTVSYDGQVVGAVSSRSAAEDVLDKLETVTARTLGTDYRIDQKDLTYTSGLLPRHDVVDRDVFEEELSQEIGLVAPAYCLYINGERLAATPHEGALEELLSQLQDAATDENTLSCSFAEDVEIKYEYAPTSEIMNLGYLAEMLYSTKTAEVTYEVKAGDTWSEIANSHGLTSRELLALNPGYNVDKLQIGEQLTLSASVPYLTMTVVQQERYVEEVNYEIEYTDSPNLFKGDTKVVSAGEYGAADVVANVTYVNGEETERTVLSSVLLKEPVTEQRLQGTKERPTWQPTGNFHWPVSGRISSSFGGRSSPGGIGSRNHKGIDIAAPYGRPVCAADGGTVTYAGWMRGYGYLVEIRHGNGYTTRYGHNSSLTVSVGDHVYQGQQIARIGSTGNSTGNHCHFEVRVNGTPHNPMNYLR